MKKKVLSVLTTVVLSAALMGCNLGNQTETKQTGSGESDSNDGTTQETAVDTAVNVGDADLEIGTRDTYPISDHMFGIFLEDINHAVDGGMYAEMIKNRSFEYGSAAAKGNLHGWSVTDEKTVSVKTADGSTETGDGTALNKSNPTYAQMTNTAASFAGIFNVGYLDGMAAVKGGAYDVSFYAKDYTGDVRVALEGTDGTVYAETTLSVKEKDGWQKYGAKLTSSETVNEGLHFVISIEKGTISLDMVSLMPEDTYKGLPVRKDIGEALEALNPSFMRFPGGCVIEGSSLSSMYSWKDSIGNGETMEAGGQETTGDAAIRPQGECIWKGNQANPTYTTYGLGFYEYFELCEALGAEPLPVLNAGMTCQVQSPKYIVYPLDSDEFKQCVQDALDLVEFCKGGADTKWGAVRIAMGHKEPFALPYIAIGNEQWQSEYHDHYEAFVEAFEKAREADPDLYDGVTLIVANGTSSDSTEGWDYVDSHADEDTMTGLVDEHYYNTPDWFLQNTERYDAYSRDRDVNVFLGEYAAQSNTMNAALSEAAYMTGLERNGDIVEMACYAPLFGNTTNDQWDPDMIYFDNDTVMKTVDYYVQQMYGENAGTEYVPSAMKIIQEADAAAESTFKGMAGLGTWCTSSSYDNLVVKDNATGDVLYSNDFTDDNLEKDGWNLYSGDWSAADGVLTQTSTADPFDTNTGDSAYFGDTSWSDYTLEVDATINSGAEGFLIPVCVQDENNNLFWNLGGWGNTVSCLQTVDAGVKSGQVAGTVKNCHLNQNTPYHLKVVVNGDSIKCYVGDTLYVDYSKAETSPLYSSVVKDANGDMIIKLVNVSGSAYNVDMTSDIDLSLYNETANVTTLAGKDGTDANTMDDPDSAVPVSSQMEVSNTMDTELPAYSLTVIRLVSK